MGISVISDIHISPRNPSGKKVFEKFASNDVVKQSQTIIFLGDIFDLMFGYHQKYLQDYKFFFDFVSEMIAQKKTVYYVEGNHDLNLESLFNRFLNHSPWFHYRTGGFFKAINGKKFYFSHGDDIDTINWKHPPFRAALGSGLLRLFSEAFITHAFVEKTIPPIFLKQKTRSPQWIKRRKNLFRKDTEKAHQLLGFDIVVAGHTHVKDHYLSPKGFVYVNNGYAPSEQTFIHIDEEISFVTL